MQLTERVFLVGSGSSGVYLTDELDCNCYLVDCGTGYALIDTGLGVCPEKIDAELQRHMQPGKRLLAVCVTHCHGDHAGGASYFREKYRAPVFAPAAEAEILRSGDEVRSGLTVARAAGYYPAAYRFQPCRVDSEVRPGDELRLGVLRCQVFEAAGHSIGGVCYHFTVGRQQLLFVGDLLAAGGKISLQNIPGASVENYARSVRGLADLQTDQFYPGHGLFALQDGQRHIRAAVEAFGKLFVPV